jgi:DNA-binding protein Fis
MGIELLEVFWWGLGFVLALGALVFCGSLILAGAGSGGCEPAAHASPAKSSTTSKKAGRDHCGIWLCELLGRFKVNDQLRQHNQHEPKPSTALADAQAAEFIKAFMVELSKAPELYPRIIAILDKALLPLVLDKCQGNQSAAARLLGINRATLRKKLKQHGIPARG